MYHAEKSMVHVLQRDKGQGAPRRTQEGRKCHRRVCHTKAAQAPSQGARALDRRLTGTQDAQVSLWCKINR
jgi:hypothetical protein